MINNERIIICTVLLISFYFLIERIDWSKKCYLWSVIVILVGWILYDAGWSGNKEGFRTERDIVNGSGEKAFAFQYAPNGSWNRILLNGNTIPADKWTVIMVGWRSPCNHGAEGYVARTYIRDGIWWFHADARYASPMHRISLLAIPRSMVKRYDWYQGF